MPRSFDRSRCSYSPARWARSCGFPLISRRDFPIACDLRYSLRDPTTTEQRDRLAVALYSTGFVETVVPDGRFYYRVVLRKPHNPIAAEAVRRELRSSPAVDHVDSFADLVAYSLE